MATSDVSYLKIPDANWWKIRDLFKQKVPTVLTASYLSSALSITEASAKSNLIGSLKRMGFIDADLKPTDLAYDWRDDSKYAEVCNKIRENNYPEEVRDLFHSFNEVDTTKLISWFMSNARCGEPAAKMFARFYLLLLKADVNTVDLNNENKVKTSKEKQKSSISKSKAVSNKNQYVNVIEESVNLTPNIEKHQKFRSPELHINIQLHISPESTADQIDKIFESMAKHLKGFNS